MADLTCAICGAPFIPKTKRSRCCTKACSKKFYRDRPDRVCSVKGCGRSVRAKGLCSTDYNRSLPDEVRHPKIEMACHQCGNATLKARTKKFTHRFCSEECKATWLSDFQSSRERPARPFVQLPCTRPLPPWWWNKTYELRFFDCSRCGKPNCCSAKDPRLSCKRGRCSNVIVMDGDSESPIYLVLGQRGKPKRDRSSGLKRRINWMHVFEREGYTCWLCETPIDRAAWGPHPLSPSVDHLIPVSLGGTNERSNLAPAHFICNSRRGNRISIVDLPPPSIIDLPTEAA